MGPSQSTARLLSNDVLARWLIEDFPFRIQLAPSLPFFPVAGDRYRYASTAALRPGVSIGFDDGIPDDTKRPRDPPARFEFAEIATRFSVPYKAQDIFSSNVNDQVAVQMALAIRELLYRFWILFESGDASSQTEFDGLLALVDPGRVVDLGGEALTLESLDRAKELVRTNDGRAVVAYTSSLGKRAIHKAHWDRGLAPTYQEHPFPSPCGETVRQEVLAFDGAPVFVCDLNRVYPPGSDGSGEPMTPEEAAVAEGGVTNVWFFVMGENNLHGMTPAALGNDLFVHRHTNVPGGSASEHHVTLPAGLALGSLASLAVVKNAALPGRGNGCG